jgi:hypothetical protein
MKGRFLVVCALVGVVSSVSGCSRYDYSNFPFYEDFFAEEPPQAVGPMRIPSQQPSPADRWQVEKPTFKQGASLDRPAAPTPGDRDELRLAKVYENQAAITEMYEVNKDASTKGTEPLALKPFAYDTRPTIQGVVATESAALDKKELFIPEDRNTTGVITGPTANGAYSGGSSFFKN